MATSRAAACALRDKLLVELDQTHGRALDCATATVSDLIAYVEASYVVPPQYVGERKVAGLRSWRDQRRILGVLRGYFGDRTVQSISYSDIRALRQSRLSAPHGHQRGSASTPRQRSIATVNREMAMLRRILNIAVREGWISKNPFTAGESLISAADERRREKIITREEEQRLLALCSTPRRRNLHDMIVCAVDTGMRLGEIKTLMWSDVDLESRTLTIRAFNSKTARSRTVSLTSRLFDVLSERTLKCPDLSRSVFGVTTTVKTAFGAVRREAGLADLRFHDLRHVAATRLVRGGLSLPEVARVLGHTQITTTFRYVNADAATADRAAAILDRYAEPPVADNQTSNL